MENENNVTALLAAIIFAATPEYGDEGARVKNAIHLAIRIQGATINFVHELKGDTTDPD